MNIVSDYKNLETFTNSILSPFTCNSIFNGEDFHEIVKPWLRKEKAGTIIVNFSSRHLVLLLAWEMFGGSHMYVLITEVC